MKVIISHDVDHLKVTDHLSDLIIPKMVARSTMELTKGMIGAQEYLNRMVSLFSNRWEHIDEVMEFNTLHGVPSTFFFGMSKGKGMNYNSEHAKPFIERVLQKGFDAGVHGIAFNSAAEVRKEYERFSRLSGLQHFGIRMHYLRQDATTHDLLEKTGYLFDATVYSMKNPYQHGNMWVFPLHIMDGYEIEAGRSWQSRKLEAAMHSTMQRVEQAEKEGIQYLSLLFHDRYFHSAFSTWMNWYENVIRHLKERGLTFTSYRQAIQELNAGDQTQRT